MPLLSWDALIWNLVLIWDAHNRIPNAWHVLERHLERCDSAVSSACHVPRDG